MSEIDDLKRKVEHWRAARRAAQQKGDMMLDEIKRLREVIGSKDIHIRQNMDAVLARDVEIDRLLEVNAELLAALENVASWVGGMCSCRADDDYHDYLIAVIAKAKDALK